MRIGIDLGGTKVEGIVMDAEGGIRHRRRVPTPAAEGYPAVVQAVAGVVEQLEHEARGRCTIGIGTPGAVSLRTGRMKNCNSTCLNGEPLLEDLQRRLGREVRIANDANCFALSEAQDGAASKFQVVLGVILGTGVGAGVVFDRRAHNGPNSIAGEWGHMPLFPDGPPCYCGRNGCVETYLSGPSLHKHYLRGGGTQATDAAMVVARAADGTDPPAQVAMAQFLDNFGRAMASVIDVLDPDAIVMGGGLSKIDAIYSDGVDRVAHHVFSDDLRTPILRNHFGDASGVRGAAWLW